VTGDSGVEATGPDGAVGISRVSSGGPYEDRFGYSRAIRVGPLALTAGCTATVDGRVVHHGDAGAQAEVAFGIGLSALAGLGLGAESVIATRMYLVDPADAEAVGAAHGRVFGASRPVATMVVVAALVDPAMRVEVELTAWAG
jgi:enamine deaminase RidA (YjgF/YER057c/UK114 family)